MKLSQVARLFRATMKSLCLAALLSLVATAAGYAVEPVRIGLSLGLTGKYAPLALMQQRGYSLWQSEINERAVTFRSGTSSECRTIKNTTAEKTAEPRMTATTRSMMSSPSRNAGRDGAEPPTYRVREVPDRRRPRNEFTG